MTSKIVPREPTQEMLYVGNSAFRSIYTSSLLGVWRAMYDAAPEAVSATVEVSSSIWGKGGDHQQTSPIPKYCDACNRRLSECCCPSPIFAAPARSVSDAMEKSADEPRKCKECGKYEYQPRYCTTCGWEWKKGNNCDRCDNTGCPECDPDWARHQAPAEDASKAESAADTDERLIERMRESIIPYDDQVRGVTWSPDPHNNLLREAAARIAELRQELALAKGTP